jgi:hypothetical protein
MRTVFIEDVFADAKTVVFVLYNSTQTMTFSTRGSPSGGLATKLHHSQLVEQNLRAGLEYTGSIGKDIADRLPQVGKSCHYEQSNKNQQ